MMTSKSDCSNCWNYDETFLAKLHCLSVTLVTPLHCIVTSNRWRRSLIYQLSPVNVDVGVDYYLVLQANYVRMPHYHNKTLFSLPNDFDYFLITSKHVMTDITLML